MRNWLIPAEYIDLWLSAKCMMTFNDYHVEFFTRGSRTIDIVWIYLGFIWNLFGIYWDLFGIYLGFIRNYLDSLGFIWNLFGIYLGFEVRTLIWTQNFLHRYEVALSLDGEIYGNRLFYESMGNEEFTLSLSVSLKLLSGNEVKVLTRGDGVYTVTPFSGFSGVLLSQGNHIPGENSLWLFG